MRRGRSLPETLICGLDALSDWSGRLASWLTLLMVLVTFVVVVLRYALDLGWIGMQESVTYLHATVFMVGGAYTLRHAGHVRVDIFYQHFSPRLKAWVDLLGTLLLLMPVCGFIVWISWEGYVVPSWAVEEGSREAGGLPFVYLLKTLIPVMGVLLLLQGLATALRNLLFLTGRPVSRTPETSEGSG